MIPAALVLSVAAGIVWADTGHRLASPLVIVWSLFAGALIWILMIRIFRDRRGSARPSGRDGRDGRDGEDGGGRALYVSGLICAAGLAFFTGFEALEHEFSMARRDAERAHLESRKAVRIAEARVASRRSGRWGDAVDLVSVRAVDGGGALPGKLSLRLAEPPAGRRVEAQSLRADRLLWPGAQVRIGIRISPLRASRNPGTPDREHHASRRGAAAIARLVKPDWILALSGGPLGVSNISNRIARGRAAWRRRVAARLEKEGHAGGLVAALGIGDRSGIRPETREAFRRLGLSHLLAVSGLHVGFVAGLTGWLFIRTSAWIDPRGRKTLVFDWALVVACGAAALYAWVTGAGISVERATLLFGLCALCRLCLRSIAPHVALAWVAIGILLVDPAALYDVGAQLSFGACTALIVGGFWKSGATPSDPVKRGAGLWRSMSRAALETFRASLVVSLGTAPILVHHGMALSVLSPAVNVIAIPWLGLFVLPTSLLAVLLAEGLPAAALSVLLLPARILEACAVRAAIFLPAQSNHALLSWPILVLSVFLALYWIRRDEWKRAAIVWIGIAMAGSAPGRAGLFDPESPQVVFFEVGQGDASLVRGREATLLIDTGSGPPDGSGGTVLVRGLRALGVESIDVLAVTHADLDHRAGTDRVLDSFSVDELWLPLSGIRDTPLRRLSENARRRGTRVRWLTADARQTDRGDLEIDVLWPPVSFSREIASRNDGSLVLRVGVDETRILFAADIGFDVEKALSASARPLSADILKVAHHGSGGSSSDEFLESVSAAAVVVSAPCDPARGLPNAAALERLVRSGAALWWTGRDGAVLASHDSEGRMLMKSWGRPRRQCGTRSVR